MTIPFDLLAKGGIVTILAVLLGILIKYFLQNSEKQLQNYVNLVNNIRKESNSREQELIERNEKREKQILDESKKREDRLILQLDKYNASLQNVSTAVQEMSGTLKVIPAMQKDINYMQQDINYLKDKVIK